MSKIKIEYKSKIHLLPLSATTIEAVRQQVIERYPEDFKNNKASFDLGLVNQDGTVTPLKNTLPKPSDKTIKIRVFKVQKVESSSEDENQPQKPRLKQSVSEVFEVKQQKLQVAQSSQSNRYVCYNCQGKAETSKSCRFCFGVGEVDSSSPLVPFIEDIVTKKVMSILQGLGLLQKQHTKLQYSKDYTFYLDSEPKVTIASDNSALVSISLTNGPKAWPRFITVFNMAVKDKAVSAVPVQIIRGLQASETSEIKFSIKKIEDSELQLRLGVVEVAQDEAETISLFGPRITVLFPKAIIGQKVGLLQSSVGRKRLLQRVKDLCDDYEIKRDPETVVDHLANMGCSEHTDFKMLQELIRQNFR